MTGRVIPGPWPGTRRRGNPPPPAWYQARERLGTPSYAGAWLTHCTWCRAEPLQPCLVRATGRRARIPHESRRQP